MQGILSGIKVVEVASMAAAPSAAVILADHGAEVIKIEPLLGDLWRYGHKVAGMPPTDIAWTAFIQNRNKKSVALNLKELEAQIILQQLVASADVFLTNSPRKVQEALNHTYEDIRKIKQDIVFASINGFGLSGEDKDSPGFDMTAWYARTGIMEEMRPKAGDPVLPPVGCGDMGTATALFSAIMTGLFHRERTGEGASVSTSLMHNGLWANSSMLQAALVGAPPMQKFLRPEWPNPVTGGVYETKDNRFLLLLELNPDNFENLMEALGLSSLKYDARFDSSSARAIHHESLFNEIQTVISTYTAADMRNRLKQFGVNFSIVQTTHECLQDEHILANGCFPDVEGSEGIRTIDSPIQIRGSNLHKIKPRTPPKVGEHTTAELIALGYTESEILALSEAGVVGLPR